MPMLIIPHPLGVREESSLREIVADTAEELSSRVSGA